LGTRGAPRRPGGRTPGRGRPRSRRRRGGRRGARRRRAWPGRMPSVRTPRLPAPPAPTSSTRPSRCSRYGSAGDGPVTARSSRRDTAEAVLTGVLTVLALAGTTSPAHAKNLFSSYVTEVTGIRPSLPGVSAHAEPDGADITVRNTSSTPLVVEGYQ